MAWPPRQGVFKLPLFAAGYFWSNKQLCFPHWLPNMHGTDDSKLTHDKTPLYGSSSPKEESWGFKVTHQCWIGWQVEVSMHPHSFSPSLQIELWLTEVYNSMNFLFNFCKHLFFPKPLSSLSNEGEKWGLIIQVNSALENFKNMAKHFILQRGMYTVCVYSK